MLAMKQSVLKTVTAAKAMALRLRQAGNIKELGRTW
jgi:hypothetical protein